MENVKKEVSEIIKKKGLPETAICGNIELKEYLIQLGMQKVKISVNPVQHQNNKVMLSYNSNYILLPEMRIHENKEVENDGLDFTMWLEEQGYYKKGTPPAWYKDEKKVTSKQFNKKVKEFSISFNE